ncbi:MAG: hypothetical protein HC806_06595 [Anaerolineae bacterium]|nr:hypothetical protein [Anaerolineae bacterium]
MLLLMVNVATSSPGLVLTAVEIDGVRRVAGSWVSQDHFHLVIEHERLIDIPNRRNFKNGPL